VHGANIFLIKDGKLHTPTPDCFLDGITRRTVIALAKKRGYEVIERTILPEELGSFSECFIVGTAAEVTPVSEIGQHPLHPGQDLRNADQRLYGGGATQKGGG
jgi:branched-chain amino acid aminotransferase